jgi:hypothetical protein
MTEVEAELGFSSTVLLDGGKRFASLPDRIIHTAHKTVDRLNLRTCLDISEKKIFLTLADICTPNFRPSPT